MKLKTKPLNKKKAKKPQKVIVKAAKRPTAPPKERVAVVAQELRFARALAGNEAKGRTRVLKALKKWLLNCFVKDYKFTEEDFVRIWKGLFYAVWMSDKPLVQEELCENISSVLDLFPTERLGDAMLMTKAGFRVLATEWYGIDQHRMDKFLMLVRRLLRAALRGVARARWAAEACAALAAALGGPDGLLATPPPPHARDAGSLVTHVCECYFEEIAKVSRGALGGAALAALAAPLCAAAAARGGAAAAAARRALADLPRRTALGADYEERRRVWDQMRRPPGGPDALELVSDDGGDGSGGDGADEDDDDGPLDPRAGRVDAVVPPLPAPRGLGARLRRAARAARGPLRRSLLAHAARFDQLAAGEYPLKEPATAEGAGAAVAEGGGGGARRAAAGAARRLQRLEDKLKAECGDMPRTGLSRRQRKRLSARARAGLSVAADLAALATSGAWRVDPAGSDQQQQQAPAAPAKTPTKTTKPSKSPDKTKRAKLSEPTKPKKSAATPEPTNPTKLADASKPAAAIAPADPTEKAKPTKLSNTKLKRQSAETAPAATAPPPKRLKNFQKSPRAPSPRGGGATPKTAAMSPAGVGASPKNLQKSPTATTRRGAGATPKTAAMSPAVAAASPKRVQFSLARNTAQRAREYEAAVRRSPALPYDAARRPPPPALRPAAPAPLNPFYRRLRVKK